MNAMISADPIERTERLLVVMLTMAIVTTIPSWPEGFDAGALSPEIFALIQESRAEAGVPTFERSELLDGVAERRALLVASLPHSERLRVAESIAAEVRKAGLQTYRNVTMHLDMQRGYRYPASAFFLNWKKHTAWKTVMDPRFDAIGIATAKAESVGKRNWENDPAAENESSVNQELLRLGKRLQDLEPVSPGPIPFPVPGKSSALASVNRSRLAPSCCLRTRFSSWRYSMTASCWLVIQPASAVTRICHDCRTTAIRGSYSSAATTDSYSSLQEVGCSSQEAVQSRK